MVISKMLLTVNKYSRPGTALKAVKGVVVHYVGNPNTTAEANRNYFESLKSGKQDKNGNYVYASSQYIVGLAGEIIQCVPENEIAYCSNNRNNDTISIECCHPQADGKFADATYKSLIALVADICKRYSLNPLKDVIRHHDVTGKACPLFHVNNPTAWDGLRKDVQTAMSGGKLPEVGHVNLKYHEIITEIRADNVDGSYIAKISELARVLGDIKIPVRSILELAGLDVGWEQSTKTILAINLTKISGNNKALPNQMVGYLLSKNPSPKLPYCTPHELAAMFIEEGIRENIRGDVAWCQSLHETGFFKYGGIVKPEQNNYAGIGALNNNASGQCAEFRTPRDGVRAQIQHLKAYATTEALNAPCIDPRFGLVKRGSAPYVEWLGKEDNPNGAGWANPGAGYGTSILKVLSEVLVIN